MKAARESRRLSQEAAARLLGVGQPFYSLLETGRRGITLSHLVRLARAYGTTVSALFPGYAPTPEEEDVIAYALSERQAPRRPRVRAA